MKIKKLIKLTIIVVLCLLVIGTASLFIINGYVKSASGERLMTVDDASKLENIDCIIVLGCQVKSDGSLSHMLR
ncbi:MAG: SanA protein, partial [Clostridia bacterium]|nr:SanA protein [Clostridia bacterium]